MAEQIDTRQLVIFTLTGEQYALPIRQVQEIIRFRPPRSIASPDPWICGILNLRGLIVPIYDLGNLLGVHTEIGEHTKIVIVESAEFVAGIIVDAVDEVLTIDDADIEVVPGAGASVTNSVAKIGERLVMLLSPAELFASSRVAAA